MMRQQVNLYRGIPKPVRYRLTPQRMIQICAVFVILLFLISATQLLIKELKTQKLLSLQQEIKTLTATMVQLNKQLSTNKGYLLSDYRAEIQTKTHLLHLLKEQSQQKFCTLPSSYLTSLSQATTNGVWLTAIHIDFINDFITLQGITLQPTLVMPYFEYLSQKPCFKGNAFNRIKLNEAAKNNKNTQTNFEFSEKLNLLTMKVKTAA